ncbi:MAG: hypothetical protein JO011_00745 [Ktedonobacteraceae bacterium]|nr:hypothetical protein [Ktedonobacteraceae bacterium]
MSKTSARKKSSAAHHNYRPTTAPGKHTAAANGTERNRQPVVPARQPSGTANVSALIMPAMVALGCWGMAFSFTVFSTDPNHLLFGGMAALMALMWSISSGIRMRKVLRQK